MTTAETTILGIYVVIVAIWPVRWLVLRIVIPRFDWVTPDSPKASWDWAPSVTAILPARNEEANIAACLDSLRAQEYPKLEIIVIDDRSTDATAAIAARAATEDPRVRVVSISDRPPGWTGKTYALHTAAPLAKGSWLWFIDADTRHHPASLAVMMELARRHQAALVSLLPEQACETFWERIVQPLAGVTLMQAFPTWKIHDPRSPYAFANGQFILVERSAYQAAGGHESVRDRFVEDIGLAARVKRLGRPIRLAFARGLVECRMYSALGPLVRGWSRILYDALDRKPGRLLPTLLDPLLFCQSGHLALVASLIMILVQGPTTFSLALLALAVLHHALMYFVFRQVHAISSPRVDAALCFPLGNLVVDWILLRALGSCLTGKVSWRGDTYQPPRLGHPSSPCPAAATRHPGT